MSGKKKRRKRLACAKVLSKRAKWSMKCPKGACAKEYMRVWDELES